MTTRLFRNRRDAGRALAQALREAGENTLDLLVLALPRGGVPVAFEVAQALGAELDLLLVRKLGVPGQEELAMGAIATGGAAQGDPDADKLTAPGVVLVRNDDVLAALAIPDATLRLAAEREAHELRRREDAYRGRRTPAVMQGRTIVVIDDGLATGASMVAAVRALRQHRPTRVVAAVPVAPPETCRQLAAEVDHVVCLHTPAQFGGVGAWYDDFAQVSDDEVRDLLHRAWSAADTGEPERAAEVQEVQTRTSRHFTPNADGERDDRGRRDDTRHAEDLSHGNRYRRPTDPASAEDADRADAERTRGADAFGQP